MVYNEEVDESHENDNEDEDKKKKKKMCRKVGNDGYVNVVRC